MAHFGVLSYQGSGHLNPLIALSQELVSRGHRVTFFLAPEYEAKILQFGLGFFPIDVSGIAQIPSHDKSATNQKPGWIEETRTRLRHLDREIGTYLREYLVAIAVAGVDTLLMGEITLAGPTAAEILQIPYFVISTSMPHNFGWAAPPSFLPQCSWQERLQSHIFEVSIYHMRGPVRRLLDRHRRKVGLGPVTSIGETFPELAHITQWPRCLATPHQKLPTRFFYTGPFVDKAGRSQVEFPWQRLNGQPLIYASLGTTRKADPEIYHRIASACVGLNLQLVISLGGRRNLESFINLPGNPLVVENAPQLDLLKMADIIITHAGPNTALETLLQGKPMLALPIALDQPAVAARLERLGVAEVLPSQDRSSERIRAALLKLRAETHYREAARAIQGQLQHLHGTSQAASILEERLASHRQALPLQERRMTTV